MAKMRVVIPMSEPAKTNDLMLLGMELRAVRDRVMGDLDAAIAKVERALPAPAETDRTRAMRSWGRAEWREFLDGTR